LLILPLKTLVSRFARCCFVVDTYQKLKKSRISFSDVCEEMFLTLTVVDMSCMNQQYCDVLQVLVIVIDGAV